MTSPTQPAQVLDDARADVATAGYRLRESWGWLVLLVEPGPETSMGRVMSEADRQRQAAEELAARADRARSALAPSPAPVRLAIVDLQTYIAGEVRRVTTRLYGAALGHAGRGRRRRPDVPRLLDRLDGDLRGPWICSTSEVLRRASLLECVHQSGTLTWAATQLGHLDQLARNAAGVVTDRLAPLADRCPACRRKSLQLDFTGDDRRRWAVVCTSNRCRCAGDGCPCRHRVRYEGRLHAWSYGELDGPYGLWSAITAARRPRPPIRHIKQGHGGRP